MAPRKRRGDSGITRRTFIQTGAPGALALALRPAAAQQGKFDWEEMTIADAQAAMKSGRVTSRRLAEMYLERIERIDRRDPALRSVIETLSLP